MGRLSEKQVLIVTIVAVAVLLLGGGGLIYYLYSDWQDLEAKVVTLQGQLKDLNDKRVQINDMRTEFAKDSFKKAQAVYDAQLPMAVDTGDADYLVTVNQFRRAYPSILFKRVEGVQERPGMPTSFTPPAGVRKMLYKIDLRGRFYDVLEFLSQLENADRIIRIDYFQFKRKQSTGGSQDAGKENEIDATVRLMSFEFEGQAPGAPKQ